MKLKLFLISIPLLVLTMFIIVKYNKAWIISNKLSIENINKAKLSQDIIIKVTEGMKKYLKTHREKLKKEKSK